MYFPIRAGFLQRTSAGCRPSTTSPSRSARARRSGSWASPVAASARPAGRASCAVRADRRHGQFEGVDLAKLDGDDLRRMRREMQIIFQDPYASLDPRMTVGSHHRRAARDPRPGRRAGQARARRGAARAWSVSTRASPTATRTSSRAASGSASASPARSRSSPSFIVCDEPISALDVSIQAQVLNLLDGAAGAARPDLPVHRPRPVGGRAHLATASR